MLEKTKIHWLGHAAFLLEHGEKTVYIDPYQLTLGAKQADYVLITHDHYDHLSIEDLDQVCTEETKIIIPKSCKNKVSGVVNSEVIALNPGEDYEGEFQVKAVKAYNINKPFHPEEKGYVGYIIYFDDASVYHAGDTDRIPELKQISVDVALLPVSGTYVMDAEQAAKAAEDVKCKLAIPMHYGSIIGDLNDAKKFKSLAKCEVKILDKKIF